MTDSKIEVKFAHDIEDGWYQYKIPGSDKVYECNSHLTIEMVAREIGLGIIYTGTSHYNPWKDGYPT